MLTCKELADRWHVSERLIRTLCVNGRLEGAVKVGKSWRIPDDVEKPQDDRIKNGKYSKGSLRVLPVGVSDYVRAQSEYYYVDKTLLVKEILDRKALVTLFTRPRRFGKTLNMDMLRVFFEKTSEDTSIYFKDKAIWQQGAIYTEHQGKYPVIFLTFKDVKFSTWEDTFAKLARLIQEEYGRHKEVLQGDKLDHNEKNLFLHILEDNVDSVDLASALESLAKILHLYYCVAPIIIIDEYDTPIQEGYAQGFYEEAIAFMRNLFSGAFKDNRHLSYGFMTGILRIAQESLFSGLNNLTVNSIMDIAYSSHFGFTLQEVKELLHYYAYSDKEAELKAWYNGYIFGNQEIYNPWSVINYISNDCIPQAYWVNTGKIEILEDVLQSSNEDIEQRLYALLCGESVVSVIDQSVAYRHLGMEEDTIFSILLVAGYLKPVKKTLQDDGAYICEVRIPNKEIAVVYKREVLSHLKSVGALRNTTANLVAESIYSNDHKKLQKAITDYMNSSMSYYDGGAEAFYHGLSLGLVAMLDNYYRIKSNREAGAGRFDLCLIPKTDKYPAIIMEFKWKQGVDTAQLQLLAQEALEQIEARRYEQELLNDGLTDIIKMGIAFSGKKAIVAAVNS